MKRLILFVLLVAFMGCGENKAPVVLPASGEVGEIEQELLEVIDMADEVNQSRANASYHLGNIKALELDFKKAAEYYTKASTLSPDNPKYQDSKEWALEKAISLLEGK